MRKVIEGVLREGGAQVCLAQHHHDEVLVCGVNDIAHAVIVEVGNGYALPGRDIGVAVIDEFGALDEAAGAVTLPDDQAIRSVQVGLQDVRIAVAVKVADLDGA